MPMTTFSFALSPSLSLSLSLFQYVCLCLSFCYNTRGWWLTTSGVKRWKKDKLSEHANDRVMHTKRVVLSCVWCMCLSFVLADCIYSFYHRYFLAILHVWKYQNHICMCSAAALFALLLSATSRNEVHNNNRLVIVDRENLIRHHKHIAWTLSKHQDKNILHNGEWS